MSIRRMMLFTLGAKIKNLIEAFKTRVIAAQGEFEAETCLDAQLTDLNNKGLLDSASFVLTPNAYEENILFAVEPDNVGTNLLLHSQDWTQAVWQKGGSTIVSSTRVAPDGTSTGTELSDVGASSTPGVTTQSFNAISTALTYSIYTKAVSLPTNGTRTFLLRNSTTSTNFDFLNFNYSSTGNLGNGWFSQNVGNGWFRLSYTRTTGISIGNLLTVYYGRTNTAPVGATDVWQVWGAQVDTSTTLNEYIPTTSARIINGTIGDMSVARATTGTRVNADGFIEQVPYNLLSRSEEFENASWAKSNVTITANSTLAPNGTLTADTITNTATSNNHVTQNATGTTNIFYVASCYFKRENNNIARLALTDQAIQEIAVTFNLSTLTLNTISSPGVGWNSISYGFSSEQNGFIRLWLSARKIGPNSIVAVRAGFSTSVVGSFDYLWGAQLVQGTQPRDYFPTTNRFNVPRIDYSNGSCPSILVEPQRTNLVLRSEEFDNTSIWQNLALGTGVNPIRIANAAISPDGAQNADRITFNRGAGNTLTDQSVINQQITISTTGTYIFSVWLKASASEDVGKQVFIRCGSASPLLAVTLTASWVRFQISASVTAASNSFQIGSRGTVTLNNIVTADIWGAQLELGANATSYIPTTTATVTRNADVIDNTNMSTLIGQTEGAMYIDFNHQRLNPLADSIIATISNGVISNSLVFAVLTNGDFAAIVRTSGTTVIFISIPAASFTLGRKKIVISYKSGNTNLYVNGVKIGSTNTTAFTFPVTINKFNLGSSWGGGSSLNGTLNSATLYKTTLTDAQAIQLTTL